MFTDWEAVEVEMRSVGFPIPSRSLMGGSLNWRETVATARVWAEHQQRRYRVSAYQLSGEWYWRCAPAEPGGLLLGGSVSMSFPDPGPEVRAIMFGERNEA